MIDIDDNLDDEPGEGFDIGAMVDAGDDDLMTEAAAEATKARLNLEHRMNAVENERASAYVETDLVKRARALVKIGPMTIRYVHFTKSNPNAPDDMGPRARRDSLMNRHAVYDALFDYGSGLVPFPYYDTYKGRLVDHEGNVFSSKNLRTRELVRALDAAGIENPSDKEVSESLRSWALDHQRNSLSDYIERRMPEWDGTSRLESKLIDLFKPRDTPTTRLFGRYFWMSLYNRITNPGSQAPIAMALIGAQDLGKSYFSVLLCRVLTGDPTTGPVLLDLGSKDYIKFLRAITGRSLIANVGEMTGFKKGDMNRIKEFVTKTEDDLDFKFEDSMIKPRQWVTIMDGNGYEGLQRDDTGNRRFYPLFVNQEEDKNGQPSWATGPKVDFSNFGDEVWQIMAECKAWMEENGEREYASLVAKTNRAVQEFSLEEMKAARGVVRDDNIDLNLKTVMYLVPYKKVSKGWFVASADVMNVFQNLTRVRPFSRSMGPHMRALGFEAFQSYARGYLFVDGEFETLAEVKRHIFRTNTSEEFTNEEADDLISEIISNANQNF